MTPGMIISALTALGALMVGLLIIYLTPGDKSGSKRPGR